MSHKASVIILVTAVGIIGYWWHAVVWQSLSSTEDLLRIHFLDVGQGDATLIKTPSNHKILVDAGRGIQVLNALDAVLQENDRDIDVAVMTHPDEDHIGGFIPILERYAVNTIIQSFIPSESRVYRQVISAVEKEGAITYTIKEPHSLILDNIQFDILWPIGTEITETNAASVVLLVTYGNTEILLTGDVPTEVEEFLIESFPKKLSNIEILKAGHHGSKTSTSESFLNHTKPNAIIYSAGENNTHGHPHKETINRIKTYSQENPAEGVTEYYTADGNISLCVTPSKYMPCK